MDRIDEQILEIMKGNARISMQELGDAIGMSRVAAKKRVQKLERDGIIRGYNTCIYRDDEITMFIDIVTAPDKYEDVLQKVSYRTEYIRQIFRTTKANHIHMVAVSDSVSNLNSHARLTPCSTINESELLRSSAASVIPNMYSCSGLPSFTLIHIRFPHIQSELHVNVHSVEYGKHFQSNNIVISKWLSFNKLVVDKLDR